MSGDFSVKLPPLYDPVGLEQKWYSIWEKGGYISFNHALSSDQIEALSLEVKSGKRESFSIVIPPPNVTGSLHLGHALNHTIMDILTRYHRMKGDVTIYLPGMDHAGIATQNVVERQMAANGESRFDFSREQFEKKVWEWKEKSGGMITHQMRSLGESVNWDYERFTMDEGLSAVVKRVFVQLYNEGLIYRAERMINWCPKDRTALSNIEVEHKSIKGKLYTFRYSLIEAEYDSHPWLAVATTRPETILGDTALAVHPDDERYKHLVGKRARVPFVDREILIIADEYVDMDFGTGVVKITPAHDMNDFEIGRRHNLPIIQVIDKAGKITSEGKGFEGYSREEARKKITELLDERGLLISQDDYTHSVGHSYRSGVVVEPMVSLQWFVKAGPLAAKAIDVVKSEQVQFVPKRWENLYFDWMNNIQDWCISRQLWWGHRIPAYHCMDCAHTEVSENDVRVCPKCSSKNIQQDEDVLDTWFSSGLWPFSTFLSKDPEKVNEQWPVGSLPDSPELRMFYPTSVLVTGFDIIFFWVARMLMMCTHFMKEVPFRHIYIHGLVRDVTRQKMSKSKGNVVNPLEKMEEYGTDAFRFFLIGILPEGKDIVYDESRLKGYRAFCNKIWNTARFIQMNLPDDYSVPENIPPLSAMEHWLFHEFNIALKKINTSLNNFKFAEYASTIYDFLWKTFCDHYIEFSKISLKEAETRESALYALNTVFHKTLQLLHPVMPYITEELFSYRGDKNENDLMVTSQWPVAFEGVDTNAEKEISMIIEIIRGIRSLRANLSIPPSEKLTAKFLPKDVSSGLEKYTSHVEFITNLHKWEITPKGSKTEKGFIKMVFGFGELLLNVEGKVDYEKEKKRIQGELKILHKGISVSEGKLNNSQFIKRAPVELIEAERQKLNDYREKEKQLIRLMQSLEL